MNRHYRKEPVRNILAGVSERRDLYMREKEIINDMEKENRLFDGNGEHYGIYQLKKSEERTYQFMGMREASRFGFEIHGEDYELIYSDRLGMEDTLMLWSSIFVTLMAYRKSLIRRM